MRAWFSAQRLAACVLAAAGLLLSGCQDGHFTFLGYTTEPNYDGGIQTVYVPIPQNITFRRGLEFDLHRALVREIEAKTPFKTVSSRDKADTELLAKIVIRTKSVINWNQLGEVREAETTLGVEVTWADLRPGHVGESLCKPAVEGPRPPAGPQAPLDPLAPVPPPPPVLVTVPSAFISELGGSLTSAEKQMVDRLAVQIIAMMEKPW